MINEKTLLVRTLKKMLITSIALSDPPRSCDIALYIAIAFVIWEPVTDFMTVLRIAEIHAFVVNYCVCCVSRLRIRRFYSSESSIERAYSGFRFQNKIAALQDTIWVIVLTYLWIFPTCFSCCRRR